MKITNSIDTRKAFSRAKKMYKVENVDIDISFAALFCDWFSDVIHGRYKNTDWLLLIILGAFPIAYSLIIHNFLTLDDTLIAEIFGVVFSAAIARECKRYLAWRKSLIQEEISK